MRARKTRCESCAALTAEKAAEVLHAKITVKVDTSAGDGKSNCTYTYNTGGSARVYVVVGPEAKRTHQETKSGVTEATQITGVDDKAFESDQGFNAIQADHYVGVIGRTPGDPTGKRRLALRCSQRYERAISWPLAGNYGRINLHTH